MFKQHVIASLTTILISLPAYSADVKISDVTVNTPPAEADMAAGFMKIQNNGKKDIRLLKVDADFADKTEIHEMTQEAGVMKMRPVSDVNLKTNTVTEFKSGGLHLMFFEIKKNSTKDKKAHLVLHFSDGSKQSVEFSFAPSKEHEHHHH